MKNLTNSKVGDASSPASRKYVNDLRDEVERASKAPAIPSRPGLSPPPVLNAASSIAAMENLKTSASTCQQKIWFSFFFDGTGNNLDADAVLEKHSNIARLYRAHQPVNLVVGIHSIYIPGIGTYFREIGDTGGSVFGSAFAAMGDARLNYALSKFDQYLKKPLARAAALGNSIQEIGMAVFGFSRGAALARAFVNLVMETRCNFKNQSWLLKETNWPVKFHFMGLFDTVASVGQPMSRNNTDYYNPAISDVRGMLDERASDYANTRPIQLAFFDQGLPGADPAPGGHAGHESWAAKLQIHDSVEEVRHFVAAHEIRNSFPLDSISSFDKGRITKPAHFFEIIYPGAHSDVGGGYAPGEGGKSLLLGENLSLIPLRHMYDAALVKGVPMLPESALIANDFNVSAVLMKTYKAYLKAVGGFSNLGEGFNKHMRLYLASRFREMKKNIGKASSSLNSMKNPDHLFEGRRRSYENRVRELEKKLELAEASLAMTKRSIVPRDEVTKAMAAVEKEKHDYLKAKAQFDAIPDLATLSSMKELYDQQLITDAKEILELSKSRTHQRKKEMLRPHYQGLIESYECEIYEANKILDDTIFIFFEKYVHDSLHGFAKDATFPSDPRVIYVGGDEKLKYADSGALAKETMMG